jgi:hypothetical protein
VIDAPSQGRGEIPWTKRGDFKPAYVANKGSDVPGLLLGYAQAIKEGVDLENRTILREGDVATLRIQLGEDVNQYVFDLGKGSSLTEFVSRGADYSFVWRGQVQNVAGVWIPEVITDEAVRNTQRELQRMRWFDQVVNERIADDEFSIVNLGVRRGDQARDNRTGAVYELADENLKPRETPGIAEQLGRASTWRHAAVFGSVLIALTAGLYVLLRRSRKPKTRG